METPPEEQPHDHNSSGSCDGYPGPAVYPLVPGTRVTHPSPSPEADADDEPDSAEKKKKVSWKPVTLDPCNICYDIIICLWNKHCIDEGTHPLLTEIGNVIPNMDTFWPALLRGEVIPTGGEKTRAGTVLHCKYDSVTDRQIANALLKCVSKSESMKKASMILPVTYCEDLSKNPCMVTRACMYVISHLQTSSSYTQSLEKICMCVDSADTIKLCQKEYDRIIDMKKKPEMPPECRPNDEPDSAEKKKVYLKPVTLDPCNICYDIIVCLWNKHCIDEGTHPLLTEIGNVIPDMDTFWPALLRGEVIPTGGEKTRAGTVLHCKYDSVTDRQIANTLLKCVSKSESMKKASMILPVTYCEDLSKNPCMVTRACMYVISHLQTSSSYTQSLEKICMCVDSADTIKLCQKEYDRIIDMKKKPEMPPECRPKCCSCKTNPSESCMFCVLCLKNGQKDCVKCPQHGSCLPPIGHKNTYAMLVAGFDSNPPTAKIFRDETDRMARLLQSPHIGISEEHVRVIKTKRPGKEEDLKHRVKEAFSVLRQQLESSPDKLIHSCFYFYFTGHSDGIELTLGSEHEKMAAEDLKKELRKLQVDNILIILDCCYSGGAELTEHFNSIDYCQDTMVSMSSYSLDGVDSLMYLPKLWNMEEKCQLEGKRRGRRNKTKVYQWSSCRAKEKSYVRKESLFTNTIVDFVKGDLCQMENGKCRECSQYRLKVMNVDGIFLDTIHKSVVYHVSRRARLMEKDRQQHPQLDSSHDHDHFLFAFHSFS